MFKLPPVKFEAAFILGVLWMFLMMLAIATSVPGNPKPNTVPSAIFLTLALLEWAFVCWGALVSATIRNWIFVPSQALEEAAIGLLIGDCGTIVGIIYVLHRRWTLWQ